VDEVEVVAVEVAEDEGAAQLVEEDQRVVDVAVVVEAVEEGEAASVARTSPMSNLNALPPQVRRCTRSKNDRGS
jgi:hypothetical protein